MAVVGAVLQEPQKMIQQNLLTVGTWEQIHNHQCGMVTEVKENQEPVIAKIKPSSRGSTSGKLTSTLSLQWLYH